MASTTGAPTALDGDALVVRLQRERDDALRQVLDATRSMNEMRGRCSVVEHELESLQDRDSFEEAIWWRLNHADTDEGALRERLAAAPRSRRAAMELSLRDASSARESVERSVRRVHTATDLEWPRLRHDLESALADLERALRRPE